MNAKVTECARAARPLTTYNLTRVSAHQADRRTHTHTHTPWLSTTAQAQLKVQTRKVVEVEASIKAAALLTTDTTTVSSPAAALARSMCAFGYHRIHTDFIPDTHR